jgi:hypothetical protein
MSKKKKGESTEHRHLREFVNSIISKDYATANVSLDNVVKEKVKSRVNKILQES